MELALPRDLEDIERDTVYRAHARLPWLAQYLTVESAPATPTAKRRKPAREAPVGGRKAKAPKPMSAKVRDAKAVIAATETLAGDHGSTPSHNPGVRPRFRCPLTPG